LPAADWSALSQSQAPFDLQQETSKPENHAAINVPKDGHEISEMGKK